MKSFKCKQCSYQIKKESKPKSCAYCGENNVMIEIESAENIIREI